MLKKLPGDETRNLVSTTPDTAVVFRPAIVRTPAAVTIAIFIGRLLVGLARLIWRHPVAVAVSAIPVVLGWLYGWRVVLVAVTIPLSVLIPWALFDRESFNAWIGWRLLAFWRLIWVYRRHWHAVMTVSGLARHLQGRDYVPHLIRVRCTSWADLVSVKMLTGQAVTDWADRIEHLAHGFGATSCRVSVARAGRLLLTFPRRDPLAVPLPAIALPATVSVGPLEIGICEDGRPWHLKIHGTHVLVAGATGAARAPSCGRSSAP
nr:hypothetical protein GCM10020093_068270 [Planobispora longispora]